jgi:hypothetical protein
VKSLRGTHEGETATIVGMGPSILALRADDFGPGPVIALNHAILTVRKLGLTNPIYTMQKDGCVPHSVHLRRPIPVCRCPSPRTVAPLEPEVLLLSFYESAHCSPRYPRRHVFDVERDFGMRWRTMSAPVAVRIAAAMGCVGVRMLGFDAFRRADGRRAYGGPANLVGYSRSGAQAEAVALTAGLAISWD